MKYVVQIVSGTILAYFITLPTLFASHDAHHDTATDSFHKIWFENAQPTLACGLCDFYFDQIAISLVSPIYYSKSVFCGSNYCHIENITVALQHKFLLRGPPAV